MKNKTAIPYIMLIFRSLIYGSSIFFTGSLLKSTDVFDVLAIRFLISAVAFILLAMLGVIKINYKGKAIALLFATAFFEPIGYFIFEAIGIGGTTTMIAGMLSSLSAVFTIVFEAIILKEHTNTLQKLLILCSISGTLFITICSNIGKTGTNSIFGIAFLFLAYLCGTLFVIFSRKSSRHFSTAEITFFTTMVGAVVFNSINIMRHLSNGTMNMYFKPLFNVQNLIGFLFLSILSSIVATAMNNYAISKIQASSIAALGGLSTIVAIILGIIVNHEVLHWYHVVGTVLILSGSIGVNYITQKRAAQKRTCAQSD